MKDIDPPTLVQTLASLPRSGLEIFRLSLLFRRLVAKAPRGDGHPVLALPGYGGGDGSMVIMRQFFERIGYQPFALDLGVNFEAAEDRIRCIEDAVAFREKMTALVKLRVAEIYHQTGQTVSLVGWSMDGLYGFDLSQQAPQMIRQLITLGAPFGDPRGTSMFNLMRRINRSNVAIEDQDFSLWLDKTQLKTAAVPICIVYSERDGIVASDIAMLAEASCLEHIEISSSHIGFTVNPEVYALLGELLYEA